MTSTLSLDLEPIIISNRKKQTQACVACKKRHHKCSGSHPCVSCVSKNQICIFESSNKRGPKSKKLKSNDNDTSPSSSPLSSPSPSSPSTLQLSKFSRMNTIIIIINFN